MEVSIDKNLLHILQAIIFLHYTKHIFRVLLAKIYPASAML